MKVNGNVHVYSPDSPHVFSGLCNYTPGTETYSFVILSSLVSI